MPDPSPRSDRPLVALPITLKKGVVLDHYDRDILYEMSKEELIQQFGWKTTGNLRLEPFFVNVIWQFYEQIKAGHPPEFFYKHGFIRGMWYPIKTPMSRHGFPQFKEDLSGTMGKALALLVSAGLLTYAEFEFTDENASSRVVGSGNAHIILMTEKAGFFGMLKQASQLYGCTVTATGGMGALSSTSYLVTEIAAKGVDIARQEFAVLSLCDFDPTGYNIGEEFVKDLKACGVRHFRHFEQYGRKDYPWLDLVQLKTLEPGEDINDHYYRIHRRFTKPPKHGGHPPAKIWARTTGGIDGRGGAGEKWKLGMQADEYREAYIAVLVDRAIQPLLSLPAEIVQRRRQMTALKSALSQYLVYRMTHP